jgi:hypothetical protein
MDNHYTDIITGQWSKKAFQEARGCLSIGLYNSPIRLKSIAHQIQYLAQKRATSRLYCHQINGNYQILTAQHMCIIATTKLLMVPIILVVYSNAAFRR